MANTTDQLIQQAKDEIETRLITDVNDAYVVAQTLEALVNVKRMEQITEQEADN